MEFNGFIPDPEAVEANVKAIIPQQGIVTDQKAAEATPPQQESNTGRRFSFSLEDATTPAPDKIPGLTAKGRVKFTTMLKPELREKLDNLAAKNGISTADVLERVIIEYFGIWPFL